MFRFRLNVFLLLCTYPLNHAFLMYYIYSAKASEAITLVLPPPPKEQVANPSAVLPHLPSTRERAEIAAEKEKNTFKGPFLAIWAPSTAEAELKARPDGM